jgi:hypothetical protein
VTATLEIGPAWEAVRALTREPVPDHLLGWAARCHDPAGFPLLGTAHRAEPYEALQWNGARAALAGLGQVELVTLTGLVTAWQLDRSFGDLGRAVATALRSRDELAGVELMASPMTLEVVTTAICAAHLHRLAPGDLAQVVDLAGTLLMVDDPAGTGAEGAARAAGHVAATGWLTVQTQLAGLTAYPGSFMDTLAVAEVDGEGPDPTTPVRALLAELA